MNTTKRLFAAMMLLVATSITALAANIKGKVVDRQTGEALIGATVMVGDNGCATDVNGEFELKGLKRGNLIIIIKYVGYKTLTLKASATDSPNAEPLTIEMEEDRQTLGEVTVTGMSRQNTDAAMIEAAKLSNMVVSNISAQEIKRSQDSNAGEVIRRVPGISIIDDKFVMVRGLSQRYNNVWVNGGAVPSSEADSRAFSFDIIPSSQIDNLTIVKSPSAEYPADYSGGFIIVNTKEIPTSNGFSLMLGGNWNTSTAMKDFSYYKGSATDFLGFDNGKRSMDMPFNHDWAVKSKKPFGDLKLAASMNHRWNLNGRTLGLLAAINYTNGYRTYENMENNLFGIYDAVNNKPNYLRYSVDDQYNNNVRLGAMVNLTLLSRNGKHKYQLKNIFNQLATSRYTWRDGVSAQSNLERSAEYYYRSRTTYNGQLTGKHTFTSDALDWSIGYAYANRHLPDRRRYLIDDALESGVYALSTGNDISREWTQLDEHIFSLGVNDKHHFKFGNFEPDLQVGAYGEYPSREYQTRNFIYNWNVSANNMPSDFRHSDIPTLLSSEANMGYDKLYLLEEKQMRNNYRGHNTLGAGYLAMSLPFGKLGIHAGVRFEHNDIELISNSRDYEQRESSRDYESDDVFPYLNA